jgi:hypothetical protein
MADDDRHDRRSYDKFLDLRFKNLEDDVNELKQYKASTEAFKHIEAEITALKTAFNDLKKIMIGAALSWVVGSGMFLLAVYQFRGGK